MAAFAQAEGDRIGIGSLNNTAWALTPFAVAKMGLIPAARTTGPGAARGERAA
jgi:long-subunit acyl-CoA synthetase (AMP-forming)